MKPKRDCPYCGESIFQVAKKCRFCGEWLQPSDQEPTSSSPSPPQLTVAELSQLHFSLLERSLLVHDEETGRFRMLETVRQYSMEQLVQSGEVEVRRSRHLTHFVDLAEEANTHYVGPDQGRWLNRIELDHDNFRAALDFSDSGEILRLATALQRFWLDRAYLSEGRRWLRNALAANDDAPSLLRARALNGAGNLAYLQADTQDAQEFYRRAAAMFRALGDYAAEAKSLCNLATIAQTRGDYEAARRQFERAMAIFEEINDEDAQTITLSCLANLTTELGQAAQARGYVTRALTLARKTGNRILEANILGNLGALESELGNDGDARIALEAALSLNEELGCRLDAGTNRLNLALLEPDSDPRMARNLLAEASLIYSGLGAHRWTPALLEKWAGIELAEGRYARSARLLGAAQEIREMLEIVVPPKNATQLRDREAQLRASMTGEEFEREMAIGKGLTPDEAIALAMSE